MEFPTYITLIWNSSKDWKVYYTKDKILEDKYYINTIHLRKINKKINVYGKLQHNYTNCKLHKYPKKIFNLSVLKSNLQKCIRRGDINRALITTINMIRIDFWHFVRRLIIIAIEDVGYIENTDFLVWLMIAYPNFEITNEIINYLLLTVFTLCKYRKKYIPNSLVDNLDYGKLDYSSNYINSLLIRGEYGGLKGDILLINRFINSINVPLIKIINGKIIIKRDINKQDILAESIDFHCYPDMLTDLMKITKINKSELKILIWENNSRYNFRTDKIDNSFSKWELIKNDVKIYQQDIIRKLILK